MPKCYTKYKNKTKTKKNSVVIYKKKKKQLKPSYLSKKRSFSNVLGYNKHTKKNIIKKQPRKIKGGRCFGNGVGANINNPNFSIYNTNTLKLFPYKP